MFPFDSGDRGLTYGRHSSGQVAPFVSGNGKHRRGPRHPPFNGQVVWSVTNHGFVAITGCGPYREVG